MRSDHPIGEEFDMLANASLNDVRSGSSELDIVVGGISGSDSLLEEDEINSEHPYINLALELYRASIGATTKLGFILLMNGMESLLGPGDMEPRYSTSRNAGVLLATPEDQPEDIFKRMMGLFKKRSMLFFGQSDAKRSRKIEEEDVEYLRTMLGRGIIRANRLGFDKACLLHLLNRSKF